MSFLPFFAGVGAVGVAYALVRQAEEISIMHRFIRNLDTRARIQTLMNKFPDAKNLEEKQKCASEMLKLYEDIDPYPLTKDSLGAFRWLQKHYMVFHADPVHTRLEANCLLGEFNMEYYKLRPCYPREKPFDKEE